jgi:hypothetical protein
MQLLHKYVQIRSCIYLTSSSQIQLLSTKINTYTCNPHDWKTLCAHRRPLHETKENVMKTFQFVSSFRREEEVLCYISFSSFILMLKSIWGSSGQLKPTGKCVNGNNRLWPINRPIILYYRPPINLIGNFSDQSAHPYYFGHLSE